MKELLESIFPDHIKYALNKTNLNVINEIRIRCNKPIIIVANGTSFYLCENGLNEYPARSITTDRSVISEIFFRATECSVYASNEQIKKGFITLGKGIRIGLAGEIVYDGEDVRTMKNISSMNIRIPHKVTGCSQTMNLYSFKGNEILNTIIISPPGSGKTTMLRDLVDEISRTKKPQNILIIDERNEIAGDSNGDNFLIDNSFVDVISNCEKDRAIMQGIRVLSPDLIITDELAGENDVEACIKAINCGIKIICSVHAKDLADLKKKPDFQKLLSGKYIERFVVLSSANGPGTYETIYDKNFDCLVRFR